MFENEAEAQIICYMHVQIIYNSTCLINVPDDEKHAFCFEYCFTNDTYLSKQRYFIGQPPVKRIKAVAAKLFKLQNCASA